MSQSFPRNPIALRLGHSEVCKDISATFVHNDSDQRAVWIDLHVLGEQTSLNQLKCTKTQEPAADGNVNNLFGDGEISGRQ